MIFAESFIIIFPYSSLLFLLLMFSAFFHSFIIEFLLYFLFSFFTYAVFLVI
jgi:hypothetical protein